MPAVRPGPHVWCAVAGNGTYVETERIYRVMFAQDGVLVQSEVISVVFIGILSFL